MYIYSWIRLAIWRFLKFNPNGIFIFCEQVFFSDASRSECFKCGHVESVTYSRMLNQPYRKSPDEFWSDSIKFMRSENTDLNGFRREHFFFQTDVVLWTNVSLFHEEMVSSVFNWHLWFLQATFSYTHLRASAIQFPVIAMWVCSAKKTISLAAVNTHPQVSTIQCFCCSWNNSRGK